jgi:hypothetical protein
VRALSLFFLVACVWSPQEGCSFPGENPSKGTVAVDIGDTGCDFVGIESSFPQSGADDFYHRAPLEVSFSDNPDDVELFLVEDWGQFEIPGTVSSRTSTMLQFTPAEPLESGTRYNFNIQMCFDVITIDFLTSPLGSPVSDTSSLAGQVYYLEPALGHGLESELILLNGVLPELAIQLSQPLDDQIPVRVVPFSEGQQDWCQQSLDVDADFSENPYFVAELGDLQWKVDNGQKMPPLHNTVLSGEFSADGRLLGAAMITGILDGRDPEWELVGNLCELATTIGLSCGVCSDGGLGCIELSSLLQQIEPAEFTIDQVLAEDCTGCETGPSCE